MKSKYVRDGTIKVLKSAIVGGNCSATSHFIFCYCFACVYSYFLTCAIFSIIFGHDCLKNYLLEILGFLNPKLGTNDHFAMAKDGVC